MTKIWKKYSRKFFFSFFIKNAIYFSPGLIKDAQATGEAFSPQKRTSRWNLLTVFYFSGPFLPSWIQIHNTAAPEDLDINCKPVQKILYDQEGSILIKLCRFLNRCLIIEKSFSYWGNSGWNSFAVLTHNLEYLLDARCVDCSCGRRRYCWPWPSQPGFRPHTSHSLGNPPSPAEKSNDPKL